MSKTITIIGSGMMGSALAFPARENGHEVRLVGTPLDIEIIDTCKATGQHLKFDRPFPEGVKYYYYEEYGLSHAYRPYEEEQETIWILDRKEKLIPISQKSEIVKALLKIKNTTRKRIYFAKI